MLESSKQEFLKTAAIAAVEAQDETKCPAEITLAQAVLESGWGQHSPGNNCFGVKSRNEGEHRQLLETNEVVSYQVANEAEKYFPEVISKTPLKSGRVLLKVKDYFKIYPSLKESFIDHGFLLVNGRPYVSAFKEYLQDHALFKLIEADAHKYATDPNYENEIESILHRQDVQDALANARQEV